MNRGAWLAALAGLTVVGAVAIIAAAATAEPEPRPAPSRVYSSCLAADTRPVPADDDPCDGH